VEWGDSNQLLLLYKMWYQMIMQSFGIKSS